MQVQRLFFKHVPKLRDLALANCGSVEKRDTLRKYLNLLQPEELKFLVTQQLKYAPAVIPTMNFALYRACVVELYNL